jgi:cobalt/nickel transport protein
VKRFLIGFALVALVIAGALSYLADSAPDGLDSVTQRGCTVAETGQQAGELSGDCIAQDAKEHTLAGGPLADYTIGGDHGLTGVAGVLGVATTLVVAGGVFWLLQRPKSTS